MSEYQNRRIRANQMRIGKMVNCLKEIHDNSPEYDGIIKSIVKVFSDSIELDRFDTEERPSLEEAMLKKIFE